MPIGTAARNAKPYLQLIITTNTVIIMKIFTLLPVFFIGCICTFFQLTLTAQTGGECPPKTLTLQPNADKGKDAFVHGLASLQDNNYGNDPSLQSMTWTFNGYPGTMRFYMGFDLSAIPAGAVVLSAKLSLYGLITANGSGNSCLSGDNDALIRRVTSAWDENAVTWNNQPSVDPNGIHVPPLCVGGADLTDFNITPLVQGMVSNPATNYGIQFALQLEEYYRAWIFNSSDSPDATKRPKLVIEYQEPCCEATLVLRPNAAKGKDAFVHGLSSLQDNNYGVEPSLQSMTWTFNGEPGTIRFYMGFDLSSIPQGSTIESAQLMLFGLITANNSGHSCLSGNNHAVIRRVTTGWNENTITWNNQPIVDPNGIPVLPPCTPGADLTQEIAPLVQAMINDPGHSFGIQFALALEEYYRAWIFHSSDSQDSTKWPKLVVKYKKPCVCANNLVQNGTFSEGTIDGDLGGPGALDYWTALQLSPQVISGDYCADPGAVLMWGNQKVGEGIKQLLNFQAGQAYEISFCGKWHPEVQPNVRFLFLASQGALIPGINSEYPVCGADCEEMILSPILTTSWATYTGQWTPSQNYDNLNILVSNNFNINNGSYVSWGIIDDICIRKAQASATKDIPTLLSGTLFPNPTSGDATLEFGTPLSNSATLVVSDLLGRVLRKLEVPRGATSLSVPLSDVPTGIYLTQVISSGKLLWSGKVVKAE